MNEGRSAMRKNLFRIMVLSLLVLGVSGIGYANLTDEPLYGDANDVSDINGSGCIPANPDCEKTTCKGCWCDNGCVRIEGTREGCDCHVDGTCPAEGALNGSHGSVLAIYPLPTTYTELSQCLCGNYMGHHDHTGIDISTSGQYPDVFSVGMGNGTVIYNTTKRNTDNFKDYWDAFVVVQYGDFFGYYGHIESDLNPGDTVVPGQTIGKVRLAYSSSKVADKGNNHLHFGIHQSRIDNDWGYYGSSCTDVKNKGWIDPLSYFEFSTNPPAPTTPTPKIQANGQDGPITVTENTPVSITVSLAPGDQNGKNADWWATVFYDTWFSLTPYNTWALGVNSCAQKPLYSFSQVQIYNSTVGVGERQFCFGVDMSPNGILDSPLYSDCVYVNGVTSTPTANRLVNKQSNKCVDTYLGEVTDNTELIQYSCHTGPNMYWQFESMDDGYVRIKQQKSGKCITANNSLSDWTVLSIDTCDSSYTMQWELQPTPDGAYNFINRQSGKCMDVYYGYTTDWTNILQYSCHSGDSMRWWLNN